MTLSNDQKPQRPPQNRTQKIVMWSIYGVAAVLLIVAITLFIVNGVRLF